MKVAAIQMVSGCDVPSNLQVAAELLEEAARQGAELAVLPEFFCLMGHQDTDKLAVQEAYGQGPVQQFLADQARSLGLWLVGGHTAAGHARPRAGAQHDPGFFTTRPVCGALRQAAPVPAAGCGAKL